jgi:hypothetical protein
LSLRSGWRRPIPSSVTSTCSPVGVLVISISTVVARAYLAMLASASEQMK